MDNKEKEKLKSLISEVFGQSNPRWVIVSEKIIIPVVLGLSTFFIAWATLQLQQNQVDLVGIQAKKDSANFERTNHQDSILFHKNYQLKLVELFYNDLTSIDSNKSRNALNLLALMDPSLQNELKLIPWHIKDTSVSSVFYDESKEFLLESSNIKIYSNDLDNANAIEINELLTTYQAQSAFLGIPDGYNITKNEIVYYSSRHWNQCVAVQLLLSQNKFGNFPIRKSSGANEKNTYFKVYVFN